MKIELKLQIGVTSTRAEMALVVRLGLILPSINAKAKLVLKRAFVKKRRHS